MALTVRLPREMHNRMRKMAIDRQCRVNDLYQDLLRTCVRSTIPGEPFLQAPPTSAVPVTLWLEPIFADELRETLERRSLTATNVVVTTLLYEFGAGDPQSPSRPELVGGLGSSRVAMP